MASCGIKSGPASITTLGTITTGVWNGTDIALANIVNGTADQIIKTNAGGTALEFGLIGDANTDTFTTTKITTLSKSLLNTEIVYTDQSNVFGDFNQTFKDDSITIESPDGLTPTTLVNAQQTLARNLTIPILTANRSIVVTGEASQITIGTEVTGASTDLTDTADIAYLNTANVYIAGVRQDFLGLLAGTSGLNVGGIAGNPTTQVDGDIWLNTSTNQIFGRINGVDVDLGVAQTPITQDIDYDGFDIKDISNVEFRSSTGDPPDSVQAIFAENGFALTIQVPAAGMIKFKVDTDIVASFDVDGLFAITGGIKFLSATTGDILKATGQVYSPFSMGAANTVLQVNAGGTDIEYGLIADANTDTFTTTKISTTDKLLLNSTIVYNDQPNAYVAGNRQDFLGLLAGTSGLNVGGIAGNPTTQVNGDIWLNTSTNQIFGRINGVDIDLGVGGGTGLTSINADTTPAQIIAAGTGLGIVDAGPIHTLSIDSTVVTLTGVQTLTNKTIDGGLNTIIDINETQMTVSVGVLGTVLTSNGVGASPTYQAPATGDVFGPASATDNAIARFDGITGKLIQNGIITIDDVANVAEIRSLIFTSFTSGPGSSTTHIALVNTDFHINTTTGNNIQFLVQGVTQYQFDEGAANFNNNNLTMGTAFIQFSSIPEPGVSGSDSVGRVFMDVGNQNHLSIRRNDASIDLEATSFIGFTADADLDMGLFDINNIQNLIHNISTSGIDIDFLEDTLQTISITADTTFTTANIVAGKSKTLKITTDGTLRTLDFPAWDWVSDIPTDQAANKNGYLTLTAYGSTDASIVAAYQVGFL